MGKRVFEHIGIDKVLGGYLHRKWCDKALRGTGHDNTDRGAPASQPFDQVNGFIGSHTAGDAYDY